MASCQPSPESARRGRRRPRRGASQRAPAAGAGLGGRDAVAAQLMVVVKADGYGHGMVPVARAARAAGAEWLGVATCAEALALRGAGDPGRVLCWLAAPGTDFAPVVEADIDVTASSLSQLEEIVRGARRGRADRPGAAEGRHRAVAQRRPPRRVAGPGHGRAFRAGRRHDPRDRPLVALRLLRRAGPPGQRGPAGGLRGGARAGHGRRAGARGAAPGQLGGGAAAPAGALRPGAGGHLRLRLQPGS